MGNVETELRALKEIASFHNLPQVSYDAGEIEIAYWTWNAYPGPSGIKYARTGHYIAFDNYSLPETGAIYYGQIKVKHITGVRLDGRYAKMNHLTAPVVLFPRERIPDKMDKESIEAIKRYFDL